MPQKLSLNASLYAETTAAGAYYAVANPASDLGRKMLVRILKEGAKVPLSEEVLQGWAETSSADQAIELLYRLQRLEFVQGTDVPQPPPEGNLESLLPGLLAQLCESGRALLADDNGLYLACAGFHHESAEEIAALAGDMLALSQRHALLLKNNLSINSSAWAISDPAGRAELAFYPLHMGRQSFMLILGGTPQLHSEAFVTLLKVLARRYA